MWRDGRRRVRRRSAPTSSARRSRSSRRRRRRRSRRRARLLVMGHIDEIGLIVTHIDDDGYLWFREVGGWDAQILVGQRVVLDTRDGPVTGVVGKKPIHLLRDEERKKVAEIRELHIDIGARDGEQARELVRDRRRRRDRRRARRAAQRAARPRARSTTASARSSRSRRRAWSREAGGARVGARRGRGRAGGDHLRRLAHERLLARARRGDRGRRHARHRRARHRRQGGGQARARLGAGDQPRLDAQPARSSSCCHDTAEAEKIPFTIEATGARHRHRRRRRAPQPRRRAHRRSCRSRCATCTRRSSSCSSTTSHACARLIAAAALRARRRRPRSRAEASRRAEPHARRARPRGSGGARQLGDLGRSRRPRPGSRRSTSMRRPSGPEWTLRLVSGADAHERLAVELHALAFDVHPAGAAERHEDLLLAALARGRVRGSRRSSAAAGSPACRTRVTPSSARAFTNPPPKPASMSLMLLRRVVGHARRP